MVVGSIPRWKPSAEHGVNEGGESRDRESERRWQVFQNESTELLERLC